MRAMEAGESLYVFASAHGSERHPDWYHNLVAFPEIVIEKGVESIPVRAVVVTGEERERIFARQAGPFPLFAEYQRRLARSIPVIRPDPRSE
jgi:deazaflavin-dependent oxidoreductase (nitroreductase family)